MDKIIDEKATKLPAWVCRMDEAEKSAKNIGLFTDLQIEQTREIAEMAEDIYMFKGIYVNFRQKIAVVKLDRVYGEPNLKAAIALKEYAEECGFEKQWIRGSHSVKFTAKRAEPAIDLNEISKRAKIA